MLKLELLLILHAAKNQIETRSKQRWYYKYLPTRVAEGFTLAEVLITLLIIGVVASIVIPTLIANTQEQEFRVAWRKNYAEIDQIIKLMMLDNGGTMVGLPDFSKQFLSRINYTKYCPPNTGNGGNCWANNVTCLNGTTTCPYSITNLDSIMYSIILSNGTIVAYGWYNSNCNATDIWGRPYPVCGAIFVDVNGLKGPNAIGRDIYGMSIIRNGILPWGAVQFTGSAFNASTCNDNLSGWGCSAKYLLQ